MNKQKHEQENFVTSPDVAHESQRPFSMVASDIATKVKPPAFGLPSLDLFLHGWKRRSNFIISGRYDTGTSNLTLTFAENFATNHGEVIWLCLKDDMRPICERLVFRDAGIDVNDFGPVHLGDAEKLATNRAYLRIVELPLNFYDIDQCDGAALDREFLTFVTSSDPTLIIVDEFLFDEAGLNPSEIQLRRTNLFRMIEELQKTNPDWRVLWHLPVSDWLDTDYEKPPTVDDLYEPTQIGAADVVMFTHRQADTPSRYDAELVIVKNRFGSAGTIPLHYNPARLTWSERDNVK